MFLVFICHECSLSVWYSEHIITYHNCLSQKMSFNKVLENLRDATPPLAGCLHLASLLVLTAGLYFL